MADSKPATPGFNRPTKRPSLYEQTEGDGPIGPEIISLAMPAEIRICDRDNVGVKHDCFGHPRYFPVGGVRVCNVETPCFVGHKPPVRSEVLSYLNRVREGLETAGCMGYPVVNLFRQIRRLECDIGARNESAPTLTLEDSIRNGQRFADEFLKPLPPIIVSLADKLAAQRNNPSSYANAAKGRSFERRDSTTAKVRRTQEAYRSPLLTGLGGAAERGRHKPPTPEAIEMPEAPCPPLPSMPDVMDVVESEGICKGQKKQSKK